jgi:hypothetical protein
LGDAVGELDDAIEGSADEGERERLPGGPADALDATCLDDRVALVVRVPVGHGRSLPLAGNLIWKAPP